MQQAEPNHYDRHHRFLLALTLLLQALYATQNLPEQQTLDMVHSFAIWFKPFQLGSPVQHLPSHQIDAERRSLFLSFLVKPCLTSVLPTHRLLVEYSDPARAGGSLAVVDPAMGTLTDLHTPFTSFGSLSVAQVIICYL